MSDDELRDELGADITEVLSTRAHVPASSDTALRVERRAARVRSRRRVTATAVVVAMGATALGVIAARGDEPERIRVVTSEPSSTVSVNLPGYRIVSYRGVHVEVPAHWPVVDGMHTGFCAGPFPADATAFVGPQDNGAPSCPYIPRDPSKPTPDGVWLQPGVRPADARAVTLPSGQTIFEEQTRPVNATEQFWYRGLFVEIAIGPDPSIARAIRNSIGYTVGAPNTPAAGACARPARDPGAMPRPERLDRQLVLNGGNFTLDPPRPTDRASMSVAQAWNQTGPKEWFERYRLILARYTGKYPAHVGPNGSLVPMNHNELAWVIYAVPTSPEINGCGGWGLDVFDATTGKEQGSSGYSPGP